MSNRPDFLTYAKHLYKKYFGTSYAPTAIVCDSSKQYAQINSSLFKVFRFLYIAGTVFGFYLMFTQFGIQVGIAFLAASLLLYIGISMLKYCFTDFVKVDSDGRPIDSPDSQDILKLDKPPFRAYVRSWRRVKGAVDIQIPIVYNAQEYYIYPFKTARFFESLMLALASQIWFGAAVYMSFAHNVVTFFGIILVLLILSPLKYFFVGFYQEEYNNDFFIQDEKINEVKQFPLNYIMKGIVIVLVFALLIVAFVVTNRDYSFNRIEINPSIAYNEAYEIADTYAKEQCSDDARLYRFFIYLDGKEAVQKRQPTSWDLYFQDPPSGVFSDPNQTMFISKDVDSNHMFTAHEIYVRTESMRSAPTLQVDVGEILNILETVLEISIDDMQTTYIRISGGVDRECLERNTCLVSLKNKEYIVDFENKTAWKE